MKHRISLDIARGFIPHPTHLRRRSEFAAKSRMNLSKTLFSLASRDQCYRPCA